MREALGFAKGVSTSVYRKVSKNDIVKTSG